MSIATRFPLKSRAIVTHSDNYEMLLIRVAHHLWKWYRQSLKEHDFTARKAYAQACADVWMAKALYRKPFQERNQANKKATAERMRKKVTA